MLHVCSFSFPFFILQRTKQLSLLLSLLFLKFCVMIFINRLVMLISQVRVTSSNLERSCEQNCIQISSCNVLFSRRSTGICTRRPVIAPLFGNFLLERCLEYLRFFTEDQEA